MACLALNQFREIARRCKMSNKKLFRVPTPFSSFSKNKDEIASLLAFAYFEFLYSPAVK